MADLKGYLPPEGPQNVHGVPHDYLESQGSHRVADTVVNSPESVILTGDPDAQEQIEQAGLEAVPAEVAEEALEAYQDEEAQASQVIEEWQEATDGQEPEDAEDEAPPEDDSEGPAIPSDLSDLDYRGEDTITLQHLAQAYGIPANQGADELREALREERDS